MQKPKILECRPREASPRGWKYFIFQKNDNFLLDDIKYHEPADFANNNNLNRGQQQQQQQQFQGGQQQHQQQQQQHQPQQTRQQGPNKRHSHHPQIPVKQDRE